MEDPAPDICPHRVCAADSHEHREGRSCPHSLGEAIDSPPTCVGSTRPMMGPQFTPPTDPHMRREHACWPAGSASYVSDFAHPSGPTTPKNAPMAPPPAAVSTQPTSPAASTLPAAVSPRPYTNGWWRPAVSAPTPRSLTLRFVPGARADRDQGKRSSPGTQAPESRHQLLRRGSGSSQPTARAACRADDPVVMRPRAQARHHLRLPDDAYGTEEAHRHVTARPAAHPDLPRYDGRLETKGRSSSRAERWPCLSDPRLDHQPYADDMGDSVAPTHERAHESDFAYARP